MTLIDGTDWSDSSTNEQAVTEYSSRAGWYKKFGASASDCGDILREEGS